MNSNLKRLESQELKSKSEISSINIQNIQSNTMNQSYTSLKSDLVTTYIQIMKADIIQLNDKINESSHIVSIIGKTGNSTVKKRINEIEEDKSKGIKNLIDKTIEDSSDIDKLSRLYKTTSKSELIIKLSNELAYNELLMKKLSDFAFLNLISLRQDVVLKETHSKVSIIINLIESLKELYSHNSKVMITESSVGQADNEFKKTADFILNSKSIMNFFNNDSDRYIMKIEEMVSDYIKDDINKTVTLMNEYLKSNIKRLESVNENYKLEIFNKKKLEIERFLVEFHKENQRKDEKISSFLMENEGFIKEKGEIQMKYSCIMLENEKLIKEISVLKEKLTASSVSSTSTSLSIGKIEKIDERTKEDLIKIINEANSILDNFKSSQKESFDKLLSEISVKDEEISKLNIQISIIEEEKRLLNEQIQLIKSRHGVVKDAYEELLLEQFDVMRKAFIQKLEDMNSELMLVKNGYRRNIIYMEEELKQEKHIKDLFLRQIGDLQKMMSK